MSAHWSLIPEWPVKEQGHFSHFFPGGSRELGKRLLKPGETQPTGSHELDMIRAGETIGFSFNFVDYWGPEIVVRFTDDAGLHWQIDGYLHLQEPTPAVHGIRKWLQAVSW